MDAHSALQGLMWGPSLPGRSSLSLVALLTGIKVDRFSWSRLRDRGMEYLKRWRSQLVTENVDANPNSVIGVRVGHDGTPGTIIIASDGSGNQSSKGMAKQGADLLVVTCRVWLHKTKSMIQLPCDLIGPMHRKRGVDLMAAILPLLKKLDDLLHCAKSTVGRIGLLYQCIDSGGGNARLKRYLECWGQLCDVSRGRGYVAWKVVTQFCGYHMSQLSLSNETKEVLGCDAKFILRRWHIMVRKICYHKVELVDGVSDFLDGRFVLSSGSDVLVIPPQYNPREGRDVVAYTDEADALFRVLIPPGMRSSTTQSHASLTPDLPRDVTVRLWKEAGKLVAESRQEAKDVLVHLLRKIQVPVELRWISLGRLRYLYLLSKLGGKQLVEEVLRGAGFCKGVVGEWDAVCHKDNMMIKVLLMANVVDAIHVETMENRGLQGRSLTTRMTELMETGYAEVGRCWGDIPHLFDSHEEARAGAVHMFKAALNSSCRILDVDGDGCVRSLTELVDDDTREEAVETLRNLPGFSDVSFLSGIGRDYARDFYVGYFGRRIDPQYKQ